MAQTSYDRKKMYLRIKVKGTTPMELDDLRIFYRVIRKYRLAFFDPADEERMAQEDCAKPCPEYFFVIHDCLYLREAVFTLQKILNAKIEFSYRTKPFPEQIKKEELKNVAAV